MSVFMEKSGVGERSPHFFRAEGLQLQGARLPFGRASPRISHLSVLQGTSSRPKEG
jgi:hypothetical protein